MDVNIYRENYSGTDLILAGAFEGQIFGVNLETLFKGEKAYLIQLTDDALCFSYDLIADEVEILFNNDVNKYIKCALEKEEVIMERAALYKKQEFYKEIFKELKNKYGVLKGGE